MQPLNDPYQDMTAADLMHALAEGRRLRSEALASGTRRLLDCLAAPLRRLRRGPRRMAVLRMG